MKESHSSAMATSRASFSFALIDCVIARNNLTPNEFHVLQSKETQTELA